MTTTTTTTSTPAEIDTELARIYGREQLLRHYVASNAEAIAKWPGRSTDNLVAANEAHRAELDALAAEAAPLQAVYNACRWARFFLVRNGNGHVHSSLHCTTCYPTTEYGWLPELSGRTEADAVAEFGEKMCTVCFPSAPANPAYHGPGRRDAEAIAARQAEKAARQATKDAKALVAGTEFRYDRDQVTTVAQATRVLRETAGLVAGHGYEHMMAEAPAMLDLARKALAAKGWTAEQLAATEAKAVKKAAKDWA